MRGAKFLRNVLEERWHKEAPRLLFNVLIAFLITFTIAHLYSLFVPFYVFIKGYHIHHFYHGMLLLAVSAIASIVSDNENVRHFLSYVIGVGIGLIVDELGLLLTCTGEKVGLGCTYLFPSHFDIGIIISIALLILIFFGDKPVHWFLPRSWQNSARFNREYAHFRRELHHFLRQPSSKRRR